LSQPAPFALRASRTCNAMTPDQYCEQKAAQSGSSFYYSFRLLPADQRRAITALYAFCREVDDVVDEVSDASVAQMKLAWWRNEIAATYDGTPHHPVALALRPVIARFALAQADLQTVIDGMQMDLTTTRYLDFPALEIYCDKVAGVVGLMSAEIFGYTDAATRGYARDLGIAFQLTNIIRDVGEDARRGRIYLPQEDLARFGVAPSSLLRRDMSPEFRALMAFEVQRARECYARAFAQLPDADRQAQRAGLAMAAIYRTLLEEIERDGYRVLDRRIALTPLRKLWIAWRTARAA
jgi:15-cis-phytoene synthase